MHKTATYLQSPACMQIAKVGEHIYRLCQPFAHAIPCLLTKIDNLDISAFMQARTHTITKTGFFGLVKNHRVH